MTQQFKFGDHVRFKDAENQVFGVVLEEANVHDQVTVQFIYDEEVAFVYATDLEFIPNPDTIRLDWMILRDYPGDMSAEEREFVLRAVREHIDAYIRLAAEQGATA